MPAQPILLICPLCGEAHHDELPDRLGDTGVTTVLVNCGKCGVLWTCRLTADQYLEHGTV